MVSLLVRFCTYPFPSGGSVKPNLKGRFPATFRSIVKAAEQLKTAVRITNIFVLECGYKA
jgi:hypothetical protein